MANKLNSLSLYQHIFTVLNGKRRNEIQASFAHRTAVPNRRYMRWCQARKKTVFLGQRQAVPDRANNTQNKRVFLPSHFSLTLSICNIDERAILFFYKKIATLMPPHPRIPFSISCISLILTLSLQHNTQYLYILPENLVSL